MKELQSQNIRENFNTEIECEGFLYKIRQKVIEK